MSEGVADSCGRAFTRRIRDGEGVLLRHDGQETTRRLRDLPPPPPPPPQSTAIEWDVAHTTRRDPRDRKIIAGSCGILAQGVIAELGETAGDRPHEKADVARAALGRHPVEHPSRSSDDRRDDGRFSNGNAARVRDPRADGRARAAHGKAAPHGAGHLDENALSIAVIVDVSGLFDDLTGRRAHRRELTLADTEHRHPAPGTVDAISGRPEPVLRRSSDVAQKLGELLAAREASGRRRADPADKLRRSVLPASTPGPHEDVYCTASRTADPFANGWTTGAEEHEDRVADMPSLWARGHADHRVPDPHAAYSGTHVLALGITWTTAQEKDVGV